MYSSSEMEKRAAEALRVNDPEQQVTVDTEAKHSDEGSTSTNCDSENTAFQKQFNAENSVFPNTEHHSWYREDDKNRAESTTAAENTVIPPENTVMAGDSEQSNCTGDDVTVASSVSDGTVDRSLTEIPEGGKGVVEADDQLSASDNLQLEQSPPKVFSTAAAAPVSTANDLEGSVQNNPSARKTVDVAPPGGVCEDRGSDDAEDCENVTISHFDLSLFPH